MREIFVDTSYHVAVLDRRDNLNPIAATAAQRLRSEPLTLVTSDAVLIEVLTYFSGWGRDVRTAVVEYVTRLRETAMVVVPNSPKLLDDAMALYRKRPDKGYSMADCISMVICHERGITEVLTADHDFEQESLTILLT